MAQLKTITGASREIIHAVEKKLELQRAVDQLHEEISRKNLAPEKAVEELPVKAGREFLISERMILIAAFVAGEKDKIVSRLKSEAPMEKARAVSVSR